MRTVPSLGALHVREHDPPAAACCQPRPTRAPEDASQVPSAPPGWIVVPPRSADGGLAGGTQRMASYALPSAVVSARQPPWPLSGKWPPRAEKASGSSRKLFASIHALALPSPSTVRT